MRAVRFSFSLLKIFLKWAHIIKKQKLILKESLQFRQKNCQLLSIQFVFKYESHNDWFKFYLNLFEIIVFVFIKKSFHARLYFTVKKHIKIKIKKETCSGFLRLIKQMC